jgi:dolichol kinase
MSPYPFAQRRHKLVIVTLLVTLALTLLMKGAIDIQRPCQAGQQVAAVCPPDNAYPSLHTSLAFSFVFSLFGDILFPLVYVLSIIVGWSRILLGVHTWYDIAGGVATAGLGYSIASRLLERERVIKRGINERSRQMVHAALGVSICLVIWLFGTEMVILPMLGVIWVGLFLIHLKLVGIQVPGIDQMLRRFERTGVMPGEGSMYFALGVLFTIGLLRESAVAAISVILILSLGDALATEIGTVYGSRELPWNESKTVEGSIGFILGGLGAVLVLPGLASVIVLALATLLESLPLRLDDNITIPVLSSLAYYLLL